jgi:hypothetical protein
LLRGFAALVMISDHVGGEGSWLYPVTGGDKFFVSAAEAFVFISGVVLGMVYHNVVIKHGIALALMKALHRAWTLYLVTVFLSLSFAALAYLLDLWWAPDMGNGSLGRFVLDVLTLHRTIYLVDIMLMFTLLLLGVGPVILLLSQGHALTVLGASWLLWAIWQVAPESSSLPWTIEDNLVFNIPAWQVLFVTGIVIGWDRAPIERWLRHLARPLLLWFLAAACLAIVGLYIAQLTELEALRESETLYDLAFDKPDVPIGRLVVFVLLATLAFALTTMFWEPVKRLTGWLLLPLGQNALTAYSLHIFLVAITTKLTLDVIRDRWPDEAVSTVLQVTGVMLVWLIVYMEPGVKETLKQKILLAWRQFRPPREPEGAAA